jgi:hypothetical protein
MFNIAFNHKVRLLCVSGVPILIVTTQVRQPGKQQLDHDVNKHQQMDRGLINLEDLFNQSMTSFRPA